MKAHDGRDDTPNSYLMTLVPSLREYARSRTKTTRDLTDILQVAFLRVWKNEDGRKAIEDRSVRLKPLLMKTIEHTIIDQFRSERRLKRSAVLVQFIDGLDYVSDDTSPEMKFRRGRRVALVNELIELLESSQERAVLRLIGIDGCSRSEAAKRLGINLGQIKRIWARAKENLREKLAPHLEDAT